MRYPELAGDSAADTHIDAPVEDYAQAAPDDHQAAALADERDVAPARPGACADEALAARPPSTQRLGDLAVQRAENTADADDGAAATDELQFTPVIPRQHALDVVPDAPPEDIKTDVEPDESPKDERIEIDGGVNDVVLRELGQEDAERIVRLVTFDTEHFTSVGETTPEVAGSVESVQSWLSGLPSSVPEGWERKELGIWHREEMVGCTGYAAKDDHAYMWNWVGKEHTGHGYGGDSIRTLVPHLLSNGRTVIETRVREDNGASRRNMDKTGFEPVDRQHGYIRYRYGGNEEPERGTNSVGN